MNNAKEKIGALVVTYNRYDELLKNINNIIQQTKPVDILLVVDNSSTDGTGEKIKGILSANEIIKYINLGENTGGAGGFNAGVNYLLSEECNYIWMMDDDGRPDSNCLQTLMSHVNVLDIVGPLIYSSDTQAHTEHDVDGQKTWDLNVIKKETILNIVHPFNGTLIPRKVFEKIGNVKKELFIWGDEQDFRLRWVAAGFKEGTVVEALYYHPMNRLKLDVKFKYFKVPSISENRKYIFYRNQLYIDVRNRRGLVRVSSILRWFLSILLFEPHKKKAIAGFFNGLIGDLSVPHIR